MQFDEDYYHGLIGFGNYQNYPHFYKRAEWLYNYYIDHNLTGKVYIVGCGYGYVIKHLIEDFNVPSNRVKGLEFSAYAYQQATNLGLDQYLTFIDIQDFDFSSIPDLDIVVSWNVLDCLPNETKAQQVINKLNQVTNLQMHIICITNDDPNAQKYIDLGYFIKNRAYWANLFTNNGTLIIEYHTGRNWKKTSSGWIEQFDLNVPTSGKRVSK